MNWLRMPKARQFDPMRSERRKVLLFGGYDRSLLNFRAPLIRAMVAADYDVVTVAPPQNPEVPGQVAALGARFVGVDLARTGLNPLADLLTFHRVKRVIAAEKPQVVLSYTIKPVIYGSLAARACGVPRVYALITGLGAAFNTDGFKGAILRRSATLLYRLALRRCNGVIAQNQDIADIFVRSEIVPAERISTVRGTGVDLAHFRSQPLQHGAPVFLFVGRLLRDKGILEFVAAARSLKQRLPSAVFRIVGEPDPNPAGLRIAQVLEWQREGIIEYVGFQADVRPALADCRALVLPSYHEGAPRSVLEAMAVGRAVVTTDAIGCREMIFAAGAPDNQEVRWGINGGVVPVKRSEPLAAALHRLGSDFAVAETMGQAGRRAAEEHFDVVRINDVMLQRMGLPRAEC